METSAQIKTGHSGEAVPVTLISFSYTNCGFALKIRLVPASFLSPVNSCFPDFNFAS